MPRLNPAPKCFRLHAAQKQVRLRRSARRQARDAGDSVKHTMEERGGQMSEEGREFLEGVRRAFEGLARMMRG